MRKDDGSSYIHATVAVLPVAQPQPEAKRDPDRHHHVSSPIQSAWLPRPDVPNLAPSQAIAAVRVIGLWLTLFIY